MAARGAGARNVFAGLSDWEVGLLTLHRAEGAHAVYVQMGGHAPFRDRPEADKSYGQIRDEADVERIRAEVIAKAQRLAAEAREVALQQRRELTDRHARQRHALRVVKESPERPELPPVAEHEPAAIPAGTRRGFGASWESPTFAKLEAPLHVPQHSPHNPDERDHVLAWVQEQGDFTTPELREAFGLDHNGAAQIIRKLGARGHVERTEERRRGPEQRAGQSPWVYRYVEPERTIAETIMDRQEAGLTLDDVPRQAPRAHDEHDLDPLPDDIAAQVLQIAGEVATLDKCRKVHGTSLRETREDVGQLAADVAELRELLDPLIFREQREHASRQQLAAAVRAAFAALIEIREHSADPLASSRAAAAAREVNEAMGWTPTTTEGSST